LLIVRVIHMSKDK